MHPCELLLLEFSNLINSPFLRTQKYAQQLIEPIYNSVGWASSDDHTKK